MLVRAKPTGKRNRIVNLTDEAVEVELAAKPRNGEANAELITFVADLLRVKKKDIQLISGGTSRDKRLLLQSGILEIDRVREIFQSECSSSS